MRTARIALRLLKDARRRFFSSPKMPLNEVVPHRGTKERGNGVKAVVVQNEILLL